MKFQRCADSGFFFFAYLLEESIRRVLQLRTAVSTTIVNKVNIFRDGGRGLKKSSFAKFIFNIFLTEIHSGNRESSF